MRKPSPTLETLGADASLSLQVDASNSRREGDGNIGHAEFLALAPQLTAWGAAMPGGPEAAYAALDVDGDGGVDFDTFLTWALEQQLDRDDDGLDDANMREALEVNRIPQKKDAR